MDFRGLTQEVLELLSEAAVEIGNLDDRKNIVCQRLRAFNGRLQKLQALNLSVAPCEVTIEELADALDASSEEVLEATAGGLGRFQLDGRELAADELALLTKCNEAAAVTVTLTIEELWSVMDCVESLRERRGTAVGKRKFTGSDSQFAGVNAARQQRSG